MTTDGHCDIARWCRRDAGHRGWCAPVADSTMRTFPDAWMHRDANVPVWPAPLDALCCSCDHPIVAGEQGLYMLCPDEASGWIVWHRVCFLQSMGIGAALTPGQTT